VTEIFFATFYVNYGPYTFLQNELLPTVSLGYIKYTVLKFCLIKFFCNSYAYNMRRLVHELIGAAGLPPVPARALPVQNVEALAPLITSSAVNVCVVMVVCKML